MTDRWIFHVDLDAFFASVEELLNPELAGLCVIVGGRPETRGVVAAASYAARTFGVHSAMPMAQAIRLCPHAVIVPPRHRVYSQHSRQVMALLHEYTPLVEQISIDEAFLDVTGCQLHWGEPLEMAAGIQQRIKEELRLSASIGIAGNKLVAKIASDFRKPYGLTLVPHGQEAAFLAPLAVERLWGVGKVTTQALKAQGIHTIGDLVRLSADELEGRFGKHGKSLWHRARGLDNRAVETQEEIKSISHEETFGSDVADIDTLQAELLRLSERVGERLRKQNWQARTVSIKLRYSDFTTMTRQITLEEPTDIDSEIYTLALELWRRTWIRGRPVRLLGVGTHNLAHGSRQLTLFDVDREDGRREKLRRLAGAVDTIRDRYGSRSLQRASVMQARKEAAEAGALPDISGSVRNALYGVRNEDLEDAAES
jgi:DNA polymerase IV